MTRRWFLVVAAGLALLFAPATLAGNASTPISRAEVRGDGPVTLVLLSGSPVDWRIWEPFMERNAALYTMHALSLPGVGGGPAPTPRVDWKPAKREDRKNAPLDTPYLDNATLAVADYITEHGLEKPVVMGHGVGGVVALRLAIDHEALVSRIISVEGHAAYPMQMEMTESERAQSVLLRSLPNLRSVPDDEWNDQMRQWIQIAEPNDAAVAARIADLSAETPRQVAMDYMVEEQLQDLSSRMHRDRVPTLVMFSMDANAPASLSEQKRKPFKMAWNCDVRFYSGRSYFFAINGGADFDREVAAFIQQ